MNSVIPVLLQLADLLADGGGVSASVSAARAEAAGAGGGFERQNGAQLGKRARDGECMGRAIAKSG